MDIYQELKKAFDFYNQRLFHNELPECIFTLSRVSDTIGYFSPNRFIDNSNNTRHHEICLNPNYFGVLDCERTFATLVHEMVHMLQECRGDKITTGYHNKVWAEMMISIGLIPTDTGRIGGKITGYKMTQIIEQNGLFYKATKEYLDQGKGIEWADAFYNKKGMLHEYINNAKSYTGGKRIKYSCGCSNVWGKSGLDLICGKCGNKFLVKI